MCMVSLKSRGMLRVKGVLRCENGGIVTLEYKAGPLVGFLIEVAGKVPE